MATPTNIWRQLLSPLSDLTTLFLNWRFSVPFIVNQSASVMFIYLISIFPVSVIVPCVNALQFVFTAIVGHLIGKRLFII
uniref:GtrA family protein n=1 Tax=Angiostrongylus cantonensis TaxID=6313 RepID=A0A0K0DE63_ANGCA